MLLVEYIFMQYINFSLKGVCDAKTYRSTVWKDVDAKADENNINIALAYVLTGNFQSKFREVDHFHALRLTCKGEPLLLILMFGDA